MIGKAYSTDLRERVIQLRAVGYTQHGIAQLLELSLSPVKRYLERYQATGSVAPTVQKRMAPTLGETELATLEAQVTAHPDGTLREHATWFAERNGRVVSHMTIHRALRRLGFTRKKRQWVRVSAT
jgi:transposase